MKGFFVGKLDAQKRVKSSKGTKREKTVVKKVQGTTANVRHARKGREPIADLHA